MSKEIYELTNPQKSIWFTEEFYKGTAINNICGNLIIKEKVDFDKFIEAINLFVKTNDSFRLKFFIDGTTPKQYVSMYEKFSIEIIDVASYDEVLNFQKEMVNEPFEVLESLLFKFKIVRFPNGNGGFIINAHHLISDAGTFALLGNNVIKIYSALIKNEDINYNTNSYVDYIKSEQLYLESEKFNKDKAYWNDLYSNVPEVASIPSLLKEYNQKSLDALREEFLIPKNLMEKINLVCKQNKVTPFNLFMSLYALYLGRVSNLDDVVIGTPILNRTNFIEKNTSGMFINTAAFRVAIEHSQTFIQFASKNSVNSLSMLRHQKYPYQQLIEDLRKNGNNVPNLYDFVFSYQVTKATNKELDISYTTHWIGNNQISNSIEVHAHDNDDNGTITIAYDYQTSKFSKVDIENLHNRIIHMLNQIIENPKIKLKDMEIVTPEEKQKILYEFNDTKVDYPKDKTIAQLFEEQVEKTPDNIALVFENEKLTYRELNERANSLAHYLREKGVGRNDIIGVMVNRSLEMIVGILGVLKAGACYIPIDPEYPQERIEYMLDNSNGRILLTFEKLKDKVNFENKIFIELNREIYNKNSENLLNLNNPEDLSYIIYTSGSTGKPKGVMLKHKSISNLINYCNNYVEYLKNNIYRAVVSITTVSFDIFIFETLISLQKGLKLVIANENEQTIPRLLNELIKKEDIKIIQTTPSRMQLLLNNIKDIPYLSKLKYITLAGEQLPFALKNELHNISGAVIYNGYGPSETTVFSTYTDVTNCSEITIGKPLDNTQIYILDKNLNICPIGIPGELYIGGDGVGLGYINNKELTSKSYIQNPFDNNIIYKTGDLGVFKSNGEIICLGRCDNQVKIRGLRIELEEIESRILENPNISNCVVLKRVLDDSHEILCAYYTKVGAIDINNIRKKMAKILPNYMIPQYFVEMDRMPYTPNGKINKKVLPIPNINTSKKIILPRNDIDKEIVRILQELLNADEISIEDSFFELGGDSLSAINLCTKVYTTLNIQINVKDVLNNPIVADLSDFISKVSLNNNIEIKKIKTRMYYPTSSAQKRIYYSSKLNDSEITYNMPGGLVLSKMPDINKLEKCFNEIINRHETLRTYFDVVNGEVVQKIKDKIDFKIVLNNNICKDKYSEFLNFVKPFDLSKAPLIRVELVKLEDNKALLLFDMHHIISDGTSMQILIDELSSLYNEQKLEPLEVTYKDYSAWEQENFEKNRLAKSEEFWIKQFNDEIPVLNLPTNYQRPNNQSFEGANIYKNIDKDLTSKIIKLAKELNITPYMFLLSCYYILLYKYTSQKDIIVGTPIVGRDNAQVNNIIGMFVNSLPLRKKIDSKDSFYEFSIMVKELCLNAFKHQTYPFDELVKKLKIKRDTSRNPLFDTMFIYQNEGNKKVNLGDIESEYYIPDSNVSKFDLSLEIVPEEGELKLRFEYATKLFNKEFIEYLSEHYINIIKAVTEKHSILISEIDMLTDKEKDKILNDFNNTKVEYPKDKTIVQLFEEQVDKNPNAIAVVFENQNLTYRELNERANRFANYLIKLGTKSNDIIGILLPRSLDLIISIWAVLKAGAAYMLIDYKLPNERIQYMLKNANAHMLLTNQGLKNVKYNPTLYINNLDLKQESEENINLKMSNENNLAVIYTSGSTGEPKGVLLKQQGLANLLRVYKNMLNTDICTKFLSISSLSFDMFLVESFICILSGKTLILANEEEYKIPIYISKLIKENNVDFILTTPSRIELLLEPNFEDCLEKVKVIQLGGEVFTPNLYEKLSAVTHANIYNGYGPTEITACCSSKNVVSSKEITIGKPVCNTQIFIYNKDMNLCPINVPGELCVSGLGVSKGYINNEEATKKTFVIDQYTGTMLYKTGDIAKYNENGELIYLGRNDSQIKIRGLRIELSEIENKILDIDKIQKCVVLYKKEDKNPYIIAFFTAIEKLNTVDIKKELSKLLPSYMVPKYIIQIEQMPITPNGKINTRELSNIQIDIREENYVAPKTKKQKLFCSILEELLNMQVGITDDLFELGLDSLIAIKFKVELMNYNIDIPYASIFKYHTVKELCDSKPLELQMPSLDDYNYDTINKVLAKNVFKDDIDIVNSTKNNVLLLGSTGYVGMHVINSFIEKDKGIIYCIVRDKNNKSARSRFIETLHFYFGKKLDKHIDKRICILKGDLLKENFSLSTSNINSIKDNVSVIINSAANVKHYGSAEKFNNINVGVTQNLVNFCKQYNKRLIHVSSLSVSGNMVLDGTPNVKKIDNKLIFSEKDIYIGQALDNVYTRSKFEAERIILDNINTGLNAQILRLGNITNRYSDGKFQINPKENAFLNRFSSIIHIGAIPNNILNGYIEFTPVDFCAKAIILAMQNYTKDYSVLHIYDYNHMYMKNLINILKNLNINITILEDKKFSELLTQLLKDPVKKKFVSGIINDLSPDKKLNYEGNVKVKSEFSIKFLNKIGFNWPIIDEKYIIKYIKYMRKNKLI